MQTAAQCRASHHGLSCSVRPQARARMHIMAHHIDRQAAATQEAAAGPSRRGVLGLGAAFLAAAAQQQPFLAARAEEAVAAADVQQVGWARVAAPLPKRFQPPLLSLLLLQLPALFMRSPLGHAGNAGWRHATLPPLHRSAVALSQMASTLCAALLGVLSLRPPSFPAICLLNTVACAHSRWAAITQGALCAPVSPSLPCGCQPLRPARAAEPARHRPGPAARPPAAGRRGAVGSLCVHEAAAGRHAGVRVRVPRGHRERPHAAARLLSQARALFIGGASDSGRAAAHRVRAR